MATADLKTASVLATSITTIHNDQNSQAGRTEVAAASTILRKFRFNNTATGNAACHFKGYNAATPTIGTTAPNMVVPIPAAKIVEVSAHGGLTFDTALAFATVLSKTSTDTTNPNAPLGVHLGVS